MNEFKEFSNLFLRRFFRPVSFIWKKIYQPLPSPVKNSLATCNLQLATLILILLIILANCLWPKDKIMQAKLNAAQWPVLPTSHFQLAKVYFDNGQEELAKKEFEKTATSFQYLAGRRIFPDWQKEAEEIKKLVFEKDELENKIAYWEQILENKPHFRDAYLRLAVLYHQIWQEEKANEAWNKAFYLDPNNETVKEVGKIVN